MHSSKEDTEIQTLYSNSPKHYHILVKKTWEFPKGEQYFMQIKNKQTNKQKTPQQTNKQKPKQQQKRRLISVRKKSLSS